MLLRSVVSDVSPSRLCFGDVENGVGDWEDDDVLRILKLSSVSIGFRLSLLCFFAAAQARIELCTGHVVVFVRRMEKIFYGFRFR